MELEHIKRLHEILEHGENPSDRLGAGCFLVCIYGRARWSDLRFIDHVEFEAGRLGAMTLYTAEHKTSAVGMRREQYLPLVVPYEGVIQGAWIPLFLEVYAALGLDINRRPLGPLLPAPKIGGTFCARPLSTSEAAVWLRELLKGCKDSMSFRSHSLKATLLIWAARAGLDKETRSVLGHHCSALNGSEVVYSRHLQTKALRKLSMMLRRVRIGLGVEDESMQQFGIAGTPIPFTPVPVPRTPVPMPPEPNKVDVPQSTAAARPEVLDDALEEVQRVEDVSDVKDELEQVVDFEAAADSLTLFSADAVASGMIEIHSSSGSSSSSSTSSSSSDDDVVGNPGSAANPRYCEDVPEGFKFFKHRKSGIVHCCKAGSTTSACHVSMNSNFTELGRQIFVRLPKCMKCFPKDHNRLRKVEDLVEKLDSSLKRARNSD